MMNNSKYVIFNENQVVMFDGIFDHSDFLKMEYEGFKITSAGFFTVHPSKENYGISVCTNYGDSHSLQMGPKPLDKDVIKSRILGIPMFELYF